MLIVSQNLNSTGVYYIINLSNMKCYVGSAASSFYIRWHNHKSTLKKGIHYNTHLQRAWDKYGEKSFRFVVLEHCTPCDCVSREQYWINRFGVCDKSKGYNQAPTAGSTFGFRFSKELREKLSTIQKQKGKKLTKEHIQRLKEANTGLKRSPEFCANLSKKFTGRRLSEETKRKIAKKAKGRKRTAESIRKQMETRQSRTYEVSQETRDRSSAVHKGKVVSLETRAKLRAFNLGKIVPPEVGRKISLANTGRKHTEEAKEKIRKALLAHRKRIRESNLLLLAIPEDLEAP